MSLRQAINALGLVGGFLQGALSVATQGTGTSSGGALGVGTSVSQVTAGMAVSAATLAADPTPPAGMAASAAGADAASASADADAQPTRSPPQAWLLRLPTRLALALQGV